MRNVLPLLFYAAGSVLFLIGSLISIARGLQ